jgi:hypothetical protein
MADSLGLLLRRTSGARHQEGDSPDAQQACAPFGAAPTDELVRLWGEGENLVLTGVGVHLVGPAEVLQLARSGCVDGLLDRGFVPVLDDDESNFLCVAVQEPLAPRVLYVPHDDASRLIYSNVVTMAEALLGLCDRKEPGAYFLHETRGDYPFDGPRTAEDRALGHALVKASKSDELLRYAVQLLGSDDIDDWRTLLETNHFVRRRALARLRSLTSSPVVALLQRDAEAFARFADEIAAACASDGLVIGERQDTALQVGDHWVELEAFFYRRKVRNAVPRTVAWIQDLASQRDPRQRAGNIFGDLREARSSSLMPAVPCLWGAMRKDGRIRTG